MALPTNGPFTTLDVMNNKFPCEGPEVVPLFLDFSVADNFQVDLKSLVTQGRISMIQSLYVDNADGTAPVTFVQSVTNQRIIIPAGAQAYLNGLFSGAQFLATSSSLAVVRVFAQNFPVTNCVWFTGAAGATSSAVNVVNFPASQLVASDRSVSGAFQIIGAAQNIAVTTASANTAIVTATGNNLRLSNVGAGICYVRIGTGVQTAVVGDLAIVPNGSIIISANLANNLAVIGSAASILNVAVGSGGI
jgi:hypothetical protein